MNAAKSLANSRQPSSTLYSEIEERFGILPNFFRLCPESPQITANLWGFAKFAYLDNPLPSLFKERLFVHLSRFCQVRYCIARHMGFLVGLGRPCGDAQSARNTVEEVVHLLTRPFPRGTDLDPYFELSRGRASFTEFPACDSEIERAVFAFAGHVFLQTPDAERSQRELERLFGAVDFQNLALFLPFVRTAHYWTKVHPELKFEDDITHLLGTHRALADCILNDPEAGAVGQRIIDELPLLRQRADRTGALLASIVESSDDAIISKTLDDVITSWNKGAERLFGYSGYAAIGRSITIIIPLDRRDEETNIIENLRLGNRIDHFETVRQRKDGSLVEISLTVSPLRDTNGKIVGASEIAQDISSRMRTERARSESERVRSESLTAKLLKAQDDERRRISRELHDTVGQSLAAIQMTLGPLKKALAKDKSATARLNDCREIVDQTLSEVRTVSHLLYPPTLDLFGLRSALEWLTDGFSKRSGIQLDLRLPKDIPRLLPECEAAVFRVVQECLTNIYRYAGASQAHIHVQRNADELKIEVLDNGTGIDQAVLDDGNSLGVGIPGMRERLTELGGHFDIQRASPGTKVIATIPLDRWKVGGGLKFPPVTTEAVTPIVADKAAKKRILIVDDHDLMRSGVRSLLESEKDLEVCGEAATAREGIEQMRRLAPDLVVLDLNLPDSSGWQVVRTVRTLGLPVKTIILTAFDYAPAAATAAAAGCDGYVPKSAASADLVRAIRTIWGGGRFFQNQKTRDAAASHG